MRQGSKPLEYVYIFLTGIKTAKDGTVAAVLSMDGYTGDAFKPVLRKEIKNDDDVVGLLREVFDNIFEGYDPATHSSSTTFITNLPPNTEQTIYNITSGNHQLIFDDKETEEVVSPLMENLK